MAVAWQAAHPDGGCPTAERLRNDGVIDRGFNLKDPWGVPFDLRCEQSDITCMSAGPDKKAGTEDDIVVPVSRASQASPREER